MYVQRNNGLRSCYQCCSRKEKSITYSVCVSVALVIQHAVRIRSIILPSVACLTVPYFTTLSYKRYDFSRGGEGEVIEYKRSVLIFSTNFSF